MKNFKLVFSLILKILIFSITASDVTGSPHKKATLPYVVKVVSYILTIYVCNFTQYMG